jgi:hypothetical protein
MQTFYFSHTVDNVASAELWDLETDTLVETATNVTRVSDPYNTAAIPGSTLVWYVGTATDNRFGPYELVLKTSTNTVADVQVIALTGPVMEASTSPVPIAPFSNLAVYHKFYGQSVATWVLNNSFSLAKPHVYQLEASLGGHDNAGDWRPITQPVANTQEIGFYQTREQKGKILTTHVRLVLFAGGRKFVSHAVPVGYALDARLQAQADEIIRKERLRFHTAGSQTGYLLKAYRYGEPATKSRDPGTQEVISDLDELSYARPFKNGYYPPISYTIDTTLIAGTETIGDGNPNTNNSATPGLAARAIAHPMVQSEDVWVDAVSDKRYVVQEAKPVASIGGQPLVMQLMLRLLPFSHIVYKIPVDRLSFRRSRTEIPTIGKGCVAVNHDYLIPDSLSYRLSDCCGVAGATVRVYPAASEVSGDYSSATVIAETITTVGGHWQNTLYMNAGNYVIVFEKPGVAGPDMVELSIPEVIPLEPPPPVPVSNFLESLGL